MQEVCRKSSVTRVDDAGEWIDLLMCANQENSFECLHFIYFNTQGHDPGLGSQKMFIHMLKLDCSHCDSCNNVLMTHFSACTTSFPVVFIVMLCRTHPI